jgi:hypothetical protein
MGAELLLKERYVLAEDMFAEIVVWRLPRSLPGSRHELKYRLALIVAGECVLRYDNEAGKGDHRHWGKRESPYRFIDPDALIADFWTDVEAWRSRR